MVGRGRLTAALVSGLGLFASATIASTWIAPAGAAGENVLILAGNIGDCASEGDEATARLVGEMPGTIATLGDTAYPAGAAENFAECFEPSWGPLVDRIRPVPGNHDYETPDAAPYFAYFGAAAGDPSKGYYSFDIGAWHVVALNSDCVTVECGSSSEQLAWLREDLQATASDCLLAYWHHPRFSSGSIGSDPRMGDAWRVLRESGAEAVVSGHAHHYERFRPQDERGTASEDGIRQFVVGTGGAPLHSVGGPLLNSEVIIANRHGVLRLELGADEYRWAFHAVAEAEPMDEGTAPCSGRPLAVGSVVRSLAPGLIAIPVVLVLVALYLLRRSHFRVN